MTPSGQSDHSDDGYIEPEKDQELLDQEWEFIEKQSGDRGHGRDSLASLGLSGGGIRSAMFSLGGLQALARYGWLKKMDYLSTASGGGYIGSSLTWLLHKAWPIGDKKEERYDTKADGFPYGSRRGRTGSGCQSGSPDLTVGISSGQQLQVTHSEGN